MNRSTVFWFICCLPLFAQETPTKVTDTAFQAYLDARAQSYVGETGATGLALALLSKGQPTLVKGYGFANLEHKREVTVDTVFNVGSISKTVAAWGVMLLVQEGQVDLDAPVETYLKSWQLPATEFDSREITIRRLLSHTAGLSVHGYPGFLPHEPLPDTLTSLKGNATGSGATEPVQTMIAPGSQWAYSGGGYTLLQLLIEEQSGLPFQRFMQERVLIPLGMRHSSFGLPAHVHKRLATPYGYFRNELPLRRFSAQAAASLKTSLGDFLKFVRASIPQSAGGTGGGGVLSETTLKSMYLRPPNSPNYGLGYSVFAMEDGLSVGHDGDNFGWHARFRVRPETGEGLVIFTNSESGDALRRGLGCAWITWLWNKEMDGCFRPRLISILSRVYAEKGIDAMLARYRQEKQSNPKSRQFNEDLLNELGYGLLQGGLVADAVACFEHNVREYPQAANPRDSLAEAYMTQKRYALALEHYQQSLALDPANTNAKKMIEQLRTKQSANP